MFWNLLPQSLKIELHTYVMFHNALLGSVAFSNETHFGSLLRGNLAGLADWTGSEMLVIGKNPPGEHSAQLTGREFSNMLEWIVKSQ